jgi:hypothetical protein
MLCVSLAASIRRRCACVESGVLFTLGNGVTFVPGSWAYCTDGKEISARRQSASCSPVRGGIFVGVCGWRLARHASTPAIFQHADPVQCTEFRPSFAVFNMTYWHRNPCSATDRSSDQFVRRAERSHLRAIFFVVLWLTRSVHAGSPFCSFWPLLISGSVNYLCMRLRLQAVFLQLDG